MGQFFSIGVFYLISIFLLFQGSRIPFAQAEFKIKQVYSDGDLIIQLDQGSFVLKAVYEKNKTYSRSEPFNVLRVKSLNAARQACSQFGERWKLPSPGYHFKLNDITSSPSEVFLNWKSMGPHDAASHLAVSFGLMWVDLPATAENVFSLIETWKTNYLSQREGEHHPRWYTSIEGGLKYSKAYFYKQFPVDEILSWSTLLPFNPLNNIFTSLSVEYYQFLKDGIPVYCVENEPSIEPFYLDRKPTLNPPESTFLRVPSELFDATF